MQRQKRDLAVLLILLTLQLIFGSILDHLTSEIARAIVTTLIIGDLLILLYLFYRVTATQVKAVTFKIFYVLLLIAQFVLNGMVNVSTPLSETYVLANIAFPLSMVTFAIIFYFIVNDMFANKHEATYSLLAASCAYFLIAAFFGFLYAFLALHYPDALTGEVDTGQELIRRTFGLSHFVVVGFDIPPGVTGILSDVAVVEAFISNLYIIFVVGKLMSNQT